MKQKNIFTDRTKNPGVEDDVKGLLDYVKLCFPVLLFPVLYFPYTLWWRGGFADLSARIIRSLNIQALQLLLTGNNRILLFWGLVTIVVMLASIVIAIIRIRPWYVIPLYLAVMFSLCGICSLSLYTIILR